MSHISCVQTLVNANGKNRSNVFFFPKLPLSFTSTSPEACLDLRLKSGALVPTDSAIGFIFDCGVHTADVQVRKIYRAAATPCQIAIRSGIQSSQDLPDMFLRFDFRPDFFDAAIRPDQKRHAMCSQVIPAHEAFLAPDDVGLDDPFVLVRYEG